MKRMYVINTRSRVCIWCRKLKVYGLCCLYITTLFTGRFKDDLYKVFSLIDLRMTTAL